MRVRLLLTFLMATMACGSPATGVVVDPGGPAGADDAGGPTGSDDGGVPDEEDPIDGGTAPPDDAGVEVRDWRGLRGEPLQTTSVGLTSGSLFSARSDGFLVREQCEEVACDFTWRKVDGTVETRLESAIPVHARSPLSPDGRHLLLMEVASHGTCGEGTDVYQGEITLRSVETAEVTFQQKNATSNLWDEPAFTPSGRWLHLVPPGDACGETSDEYYEVQPPHVRAPLSFGYTEQERPDGRFVIFTYDGHLGTMDPTNRLSYRRLATAVQGTEQSGGWLHAYEGHVLRAVQSEDEAGGRHERQLSSAEEWYATATAGRYVVVCGRAVEESRAKPCRALDMRGELPDRDFRVVVPHARAIAIVRESDEVLYADRAGDSADSGVHIRRLDLRTGEISLVIGSDAKLHTVGDGKAALLEAGRQLLLIERGRSTELAYDLQAIITHEEVPPSGALPQNDLTLIVRWNDFVHSLDAFHFSTRTLTRLADKIEWAPPPGSHLTQESCAVPWVTRSGGFPGQHLVSAGHFLYFLAHDEAGREPGLFVAPSDLSAPPRLLTRTMATYCQRPMASLDGTRLTAQIRLYTGDSELRTAAWP